MTKKELKRRLLISVENMSRTKDSQGVDKFFQGTLQAYIDVLEMLGYKNKDIKCSSFRLREIDKLNDKWEEK